DDVVEFMKARCGQPIFGPWQQGDAGDPRFILSNGIIAEVGPVDSLLPEDERMTIDITLYDFVRLGPSQRDEQLKSLCQALLAETTWDLSAASDDDPELRIVRHLASA
ncbi:MAG: hypothetical protein ACKOE2_16680, partial [Actinomycetales bacterium]